MATVKVTGRGCASLPADYVTVSLTVKRVAQTGNEAIAQADKRVFELRKKIADCGFAEEALVCASFSVSPEYGSVREEGEYKQKLLGIACRESLSLGFGYSADALSAALSALVREDALSLSFTVKDGAKLQAAALEGAYRDALERARVLVAASGRKLGKLVSLTDGGGECAGASAPLSLRAVQADIRPEDVSRTAEVTAEWELE